MDAEEAERLCSKVSELDGDDPVRRSILERLADWWLERQESRRRKQEREIEKRARRVAY